VANEGMCRPIRSLTEGRGFDTRNHHLAVFGGAGGQHACSIARNLRINTVIIHKYSSILSAYGMALAEVVHEAQEPSSNVFTAESLPLLKERLSHLKEKVKEELLQQQFKEHNLRYEGYLNMRYQGTDTSLMIMEPEDGNFETAFLAHHLREFTFTVPGRPILVDDIRVRGIATDDRNVTELKLMAELKEAKEQAVTQENFKPKDSEDVYFEQTKRVQTPVYLLNELPKKSVVQVRHF
jgi:5-oxoprolinase (ATP-hydrolysing)